MTIQEAIESGRPFKRPYYGGWIVQDKPSGPLGEVLIFEGSGHAKPFTTDDLIATDWEIRPAKKFVHMISDVDWIAWQNEHLGLVFVPRTRVGASLWSAERFEQFHGKRCNITVEVIE